MASAHVLAGLPLPEETLAALLGRWTSPHGLCPCSCGSAAAGRDPRSTAWEVESPQNPVRVRSAAQGTFLNMIFSCHGSSETSRFTQSPLVIKSCHCTNIWNAKICSAEQKLKQTRSKQLVRNNKLNAYMSW
jgi:hypothetical protein